MEAATGRRRGHIALRPRAASRNGLSRADAWRLAAGAFVSGVTLDYLRTAGLVGLIADSFGIPGDDGLRMGALSAAALLAFFASWLAMRLWLRRGVHMPRRRTVVAYQYGAGAAYLILGLSALTPVGASALKSMGGWPGIALVGAVTSVTGALVAINYVVRPQVMRRTQKLGSQGARIERIVTAGNALLPAAAVSIALFHWAYAALLMALLQAALGLAYQRYADLPAPTGRPLDPPTARQLKRQRGTRASIWSARSAFATISLAYGLFFSGAMLRVQGFDLGVIEVPTQLGLVAVLVIAKVLAAALMTFWEGHADPGPRKVAIIGSWWLLGAGLLAIGTYAGPSDWRLLVGGLAALVAAEFGLGGVNVVQLGRMQTGVHAAARLLLYVASRLPPGLIGGSLAVLPAALALSWGQGVGLVLALVGVLAGIGLVATHTPQRVRTDHSRPVPGGVVRTYVVLDAAGYFGVAVGAKPAEGVRPGRTTSSAAPFFVERAAVGSVYRAFLRSGWPLFELRLSYRFFQRRPYRGHAALHRFAALTIGRQRAVCTIRRLGRGYLRVATSERRWCELPREVRSALIAAGLDVRFGGLPKVIHVLDVHGPALAAVSDPEVYVEALTEELDLPPSTRRAEPSTQRRSEDRRRPPAGAPVQRHRRRRRTR